MPLQYRVVVDDLEIGIAQRGILLHALRTSLANRGGLTQVSQLALIKPPHWEVKPLQAMRLAARIAILSDTDFNGVTLFMDGNVVIHGDVIDLLDMHDVDVPLAADDNRLGRVADFIFASVATRHLEVVAKVATLLDGNYDDAMAVELPAVAMPQAWCRCRFHEDHNRLLTDCRQVADRPWYRSQAPVVAIWEAQLAAACRAGTVSQSDIAADVQAEMARPSLLYQAGADGRASQTIADIDQAFTPPEFAPSFRQLETIRTVKFELPRRKDKIGRPKKDKRRQKAWATDKARGAKGDRAEAAAIAAGYVAEPSGAIYWIKYLIGLGGRAIRNPRHYAIRLFQVIANRGASRRYR